MDKNKKTGEIPFGVKTKGGAFLSRAEFEKKGQTLFAGGMLSSPTAFMGTVVTTAPIFYDIRYFTPDKFYFPRSEIEQNDVWRLIYKKDPVVGAAIDLYADFAWSDFDLIGVEDPVIKSTYEAMFESIEILAKLPDMTREFLITGKVIPHLIFSESDGYWKYLFIHNPDFIRVTFLPFVGTQPILDFRVPPEIRTILSSGDERVQAIVKKLPVSLRERLQSSDFIPLENTNVTYIPRRTIAADWTGTSILERLYRMLMFEDFLMNAALAVAQRNAVPLRLFKLGDAERNWFPTKEDEEALSELLAIAEADPFSALIFHSGIEVEYVGVSDRFWNVSREWDFIENVKLIGLGVSRSFLIGEASFASAIAGLQTFVQKVSGLRLKFEKEWIIPKVLKTVAKINGFYRRKESELAHRIRVKEESDLIIPKIKWHRSLEPTQDTSLLSVWRELHDKNIISDRTYAAGAGLNLDIERKNILEEKEYKEKIAKMEEEKKLERRGLSVDSRDSGYHVPSRYIHANIFDSKGQLDGVHYQRLEPVIAFLRGVDVTELKGVDRMNFGDIFKRLRDLNWTDRELNALTKLCEAEGFITTSKDKILDLVERGTQSKNFLSGIIEGGGTDEFRPD